MDSESTSNSPVSRRGLLAGGGAAAAATVLARTAPAEAQIPATAANWTLKSTGAGCLLDGASTPPVAYSDPAQALQVAVDDLATTGGTIRFERGTFEWRSIPTIPKDIPRTLRIVGDGGTVIKLDSTARRFLDFDWQADHDTFRNLEIGWLKIDAGGVGGVYEHVIIGCPGVRINFEDFYLHDITAYNIPVVQSRENFRTAIRLGIWQGGPEPTRNYAKRLRFERIDVRGANVGIEVGGGCPATSSTAGGINVFIDDIVYRDCRHDTGITPTTGPWGASFQIGGRGFGDRCRMINCYSKGSGDTAFEVDAMREALIEGCVAEEARGEAFYLTNFMSPLGPNQSPDPAQRIIWRDCAVLRHHCNTGHGYRCANSTGMPLGIAVIENCKFFKTTSDFNTRGEVAFFNAPMAGARIDGLEIRMTNLNYVEREYMNAWLVGTNNLGNPKWLSIRNVSVSMIGKRTMGSGNAPFNVFYLNGAGSFAIENVDFDIRLDTWTSDWVTLFNIGPKPGASLRGSIRNVDGKFTSIPNARHVFVNGTATLAIPGRISLADIHASGSGAKADIAFQDSTNRPKVTMRGIDWLSAPGVSRLTVGGSPFTYRNTDGADQAVTVGGPGVTSIELSSNGTQFVNTGMTQGGLVLPAGAAIRVGFSGAAPTILRMPL